MQKHTLILCCHFLNKSSSLVIKSPFYKGREFLSPSFQLALSSPTSEEPKRSPWSTTRLCRYICKQFPLAVQWTHWSPWETLRASHVTLFQLYDFDRKLYENCNSILSSGSQKAMKSSKLKEIKSVHQFLRWPKLHDSTEHRPGEKLVGFDSP